MAKHLTKSKSRQELAVAHTSTVGVPLPLLAAFDPDNRSAHHTLARISLTYDWDWEQTKEYIDRGLAPLYVQMNYLEHRAREFRRPDMLLLDGALVEHRFHRACVEELYLVRPQGAQEIHCLRANVRDRPLEPRVELVQFASRYAGEHRARRVLRTLERVSWTPGTLLAPGPRVSSFVLSGLSRSVRA